MKTYLSLSFLLCAFWAQAQVIPVGFMKNRGFVNTPTPNPPPVTNGLILYLDATQPASYGGSGTTWNDVSGQSPAGPATLVGSPTFGSGSLANGSGSFTFGANINAKTTKTYTIDRSITYIAWVNPSQFQAASVGIISRRTDPNGGHTGLTINTSNNLGYDWSNAFYNDRFNLYVPNNQWSMIAVTINASTATGYLCKSNGITSSSIGHSFLSVLTAGATHFTISYETYLYPQRQFKGKMATAMVYSTCLTSDDITSIFNAQKASFGL